MEIILSSNTLKEELNGTSLYANSMQHGDFEFMSNCSDVLLDISNGMFCIKNLNSSSDFRVIGNGILRSVLGKMYIICDGYEKI